MLLCKPLFLDTINVAGTLRGFPLPNGHCLVDGCRSSASDRIPAGASRNTGVLLDMSLTSANLKGGSGGEEESDALSAMSLPIKVDLAMMLPPAVISFPHIEGYVGQALLHITNGRLVRYIIVILSEPLLDSRLECGPNRASRTTCYAYLPRNQP